MSSFFIIMEDASIKGVSTVQVKTIWEQDETVEESIIEQLALEMKRSKTFIRLCMNRGLHTTEEINQFIKPSVEQFQDPFSLFEMEKVVERIQEAVEKQQHITIYGDYDADGVTSTVIMYEAIEAIGGSVDYYVPNRFVDGYGPNSDAFEAIISNGTELIITVDNGVAGHDAISHAKSLGVDVIVTDHHECPDILPEAYAIIHPRHPSGKYTFPDLSGAGVALKVATALLGDMPEELVELAAIGTIADVVSLTGENRAIAYYGLKLMKQTQRLGLIALLSASSLTADSIDEEVIGFKLAPPINAVGRLGDAGLVVDLLMTFDDSEAKELSRVVLSKNEERKSLVKEITDEAFKKIEEQKSQAILVLYDPSWHEGVLGIVASKVVEKTHKPTIILTANGKQDSIKGSGRSIEGFNLYECVSEVKDHLVHFGGHEMACGLSMKKDALEDFTEALNKVASASLEAVSLSKRVMIDTRVDWEEVTADLIDELSLLKPFGQHNAKPLFKIESVYPENVKKIGADQTHLKSTLTKDNKQLDMIAFQSAHWEQVMSSSPKIDIIGYLSINEWNGNRKVQMMAVDYKAKEPLLFDYRNKTVDKAAFDMPDTHFVFFQKDNVSKWAEGIHPTSSYQLIERDQHIDSIGEENSVVIVDIPDRLDVFEKTYEVYRNRSIYLYSFAPHDYYFKGMPKREQFGQLYKYINQKGSVHLSKDAQELKRLLKADNETVKFMIMVFLENEFVTIESGELSIVSNPDKKPLEDTVTYKKRLEQIRVEETLVYSSFVELLDYLKTI